MSKPRTHHFDRVTGVRIIVGQMWRKRSNHWGVGTVKHIGKRIVTLSHPYGLTPEIYKVDIHELISDWEILHDVYFLVNIQPSGNIQIQTARRYPVIGNALQKGKRYKFEVRGTLRDYELTD